MDPFEEEGENIGAARAAEDLFRKNIGDTPSVVVGEPEQIVEYPKVRFWSKIKCWWRHVDFRKILCWIKGEIWCRRFHRYLFYTMPSYGEMYPFGVYRRRLMSNWTCTHCHNTWIAPYPPDKKDGE